ncbi:DUF4105 domain-containing protein [Catenovulum adriaticum]|uniref:DUF4105 domain-containing protein n=1 Tax=Catenovulum adriaticum TaxID=2984846 RepID=A0ABY7APB4_9ALTE|nr:DUF4105 domain-containing protein [Catenovulum sp. TS8]WAJ70091.1 DUF4105 domain-containing protein [Catenovulum sp. TS8]
MFKLFVFILLIQPCLLVAAAQPFEQSAEKLTQLSKTLYWRHLLHYHKAGLIADSGSQIDDKHFFIAKNGQQNAHAELVATLSLFLSDSPQDLEKQCQYPARLHWLKQQLPELNFNTPSCPEYEKWVSTLNAEQVVLVFPAAYLNSPSSMYGHTLFRLKKKNNNNALLDFAVNYAANADPDDDQLTFSYKGLTGGYPGVVSVMPYYQKVQEYNFLESRDIWEYELNLKQDEVNQFVRHVWEMKSTYMDYYFFTENCSYQLLSLLDASSEALNLTKDFRFRAIPSDTVRALAEEGLIEHAKFRESTLTQLDNMLKQMGDSEINFAKSLVDEVTPNFEKLKNYNETEQAKILDIAYQYSRYLSARKKSTLAHLGARSIKLLSLRSKNSNASVFKPVEQPKVRDDQGHATQRAMFGVGVEEHNHYLTLGYRAAYHEFLDKPQGYLAGAQLEMFDAELRWYQSQSLRLQKIDLLNIRSWSARNALFTPKSWQIKLGVERIAGFNDELLAKLQGGAGITQAVGNHRFSLFANGEFYLGLNSDQKLENSHYLAGGPQLNWLWQTQRFTLLTSYEYLIDVSGESLQQQRADVSLAYHLSENWQARFATNYYSSKQHSQLSASLSLIHYF